VMERAQSGRHIAENATSHLRGGILACEPGAEIDERSIAVTVPRLNRAQTSATA
jgi:hypothetical protein